MFFVFFKPMSKNRSNAVTSGTHLYSDAAQKICYYNVTEIVLQLQYVNCHCMWGFLMSVVACVVAL